MESNNYTVITFKKQLIECGFFRKKTKQEYTCQCPFCNDNKRHCYVKIDINDNSPVVYHCFKCLSHGIINKKFLDYFGLRFEIPKFGNFKSFTNKKKAEDHVSIDPSLTFVNEQDNINSIQEYTYRKIKETPTIEELQMFQYIANPIKYSREILSLRDNEYKYRNRNWFKLTNGSMIGRHVQDGTEINWLKIKPNNVSSSLLYKFRKPIDLYSPINVMIAEGIMDVIGLYYHYKEFDNCMFIAVLGKGYNNALEHLLNIGIFGSSVNVKIFKDSDVDNNYLINTCYNPYKNLFNKIDLYENLIGKDYGLPSEFVDIHKIIIDMKGKKNYGRK